MTETIVKWTEEMVEELMDLRRKGNGITLISEAMDLPKNKIMNQLWVQGKDNKYLNRREAELFTGANFNY